jgi:ribosome-associated protein
MDSIPEAPTVRLDQFLKFHGIAETGGQAKLMIQDGEVQVNGQVETRRRRKLVVGDVVHAFGETYVLDRLPLGIG